MARIDKVRIGHGVHDAARSDSRISLKGALAAARHPRGFSTRPESISETSALASSRARRGSCEVKATCARELRGVTTAPPARCGTMA